MSALLSLLILFQIFVVKAVASADAFQANCLASQGARLPALNRFGSFVVGRTEFKDYQLEKQAITSNEIHLPYELDHGKKTEYSVLLIHGAFESPNYVKGIAKAFHDKGMNVVTILLPGHWTNPPEKMDQVSYKDWQAEVTRGINMARKFGKKVLIAGYSLGGLLAVDAAVRAPYEIKGVFTWAPALRLSPRADYGSMVGSFLNVPENALNGTPPDGKYIHYYSARAGREVAELEIELAKKNPAYNLHVPTFMVNSDQDQAIDPLANIEFLNDVHAPKTMVQYFKSDGITHNNISRDTIDANALEPNRYNKAFSTMIQKMDAFIDQNFPAGQP